MNKIGETLCKFLNYSSATRIFFCYNSKWLRILRHLKSLVASGIIKGLSSKFRRLVNICKRTDSLRLLGPYARNEKARFLVLLLTNTKLGHLILLSIIRDVESWS